MWRLVSSKEQFKNSNKSKGLAKMKEYELKMGDVIKMNNVKLKVVSLNIKLKPETKASLIAL